MIALVLFYGFYGRNRCFTRCYRRIIHCQQAYDVIDMNVVACFFIPVQKEPNESHHLFVSAKGHPLEPVETRPPECSYGNIRSMNKLHFFRVTSVVWPTANARRCSLGVDGIIVIRRIRGSDQPVIGPCSLGYIIGQ